jgi:hypothetical protein
MTSRLAISHVYGMERGIVRRSGTEKDERRVDSPRCRGTSSVIPRMRSLQGSSWRDVRNPKREGREGTFCWIS